MSESNDRPRGQRHEGFLGHDLALDRALDVDEGLWPTTVTCSSIVASSSVAFRASVWDISRITPLWTRVLKPWSLNSDLKRARRQSHQAIDAGRVSYGDGFSDQTWG